jgi:3-hydroxyacyl-[acyl-carrier-protein] dehydratase
MNGMRKAIGEAALAAAELTATTGRQRFRFAAEFVGFAGHFPGYPILPAILQLLLAQLLAEQLCNEPLQLRSLSRAKFTRQIRPEETVEVSVDCQPGEAGALRCVASLQVADERAASFTLELHKGLHA